MIVHDLVFAILNGAVNSNDHDKLEAYQFVTDNGMTEELTPQQLLFLRTLVESGKIHTPLLFIPL